MFKRFDDNELERSGAGQTSLAPERALCCCQCMNRITRPDRKIDKQGGHRHICTNPANQTFEIGCFSEAPGCVHIGAATDEHSWFAGYRWRIALCRGCQKHLGWVFLGAADQFHGLILKEIVEAG